jgi:hypothetical protein
MLLAIDGRLIFDPDETLGSISMTRTSKAQDVFGAPRA